MRLTQGGVDDVALLLSEHAGGGGGEVVRPVVPAYQGGQADDAADQPDQQDHQVHPALRPLGRVVDGVVNGPVPELIIIESTTNMLEIIIFINLNFLIFNRNHAKKESPIFNLMQCIALHYW